MKNGIIYGSNGAGKSSLGLAVFDIANHLSHKWKKADYYQNYASAHAPQSPVEFEYTFKFGGSTLFYKYSKVSKDLRGELVEEQLLSDGDELFYKGGGTLRLSREFALADTAKDTLKSGANNISLVNYLLGAVPLPTGHALLKLRDFVENMLFFRSLDYREFIGLKEGSSNIEEYIINNGLTEDFSAFLKNVSGQEYAFAKPVQGENVLNCVIGGVKMPFLLVASTGTRNLELQYYWLKEMSGASFVYIDEFDAFYHHELSYALCTQLFGNGGQLFLTTHDTFLLSNDLLRPDCFFLLKDGKIDALCKLTGKELRFGHNLEKLYRGGTFG